MSCMGCLWAVRRPIFLNPPIRFGVPWPPKCGQTWHNFGGGVFPWSQGAASGRIIPEIHFENFSRNLSIQFEIWHGKWRHSSCKTLNALHFIPFADNCCRSQFTGSLFFLSESDFCNLSDRILPERKERDTGFSEAGCGSWCTWPHTGRRAGEIG